MAPSLAAATVAGVLVYGPRSHRLEARRSLSTADRMSRERLDDIERQKKMKADRPDQDLGWAYPGRWSWSSVQP